MSNKIVNFITRKLSFGADGKIKRKLSKDESKTKKPKGLPRNRIFFLKISFSQKNRSKTFSAIKFA
mgnify:CR=1 FL=1